MTRQEIRDAWKNATEIENEMFYAYVDDFEQIDTQATAYGCKKLYRDKTNGEFRYRCIIEL